MRSRRSTLQGAAGRRCFGGDARARRGIVHEVMLQESGDSNKFEEETKVKWLEDLVLRAVAGTKGPTLLVLSTALAWERVQQTTERP